MAVSVHIGNYFEESVRACLFDANFVSDDAKPIHKTYRFVFYNFILLKNALKMTVNTKIIHLLLWPYPPPPSKIKRKKELPSAIIKEI